MSASSALVKNDVYPPVSILGITISSDAGTSISYTDLTGHSEEIHPQTDGTISFPIHLAPGSYTWLAGADAVAVPPFEAPYNQAASDNASTSYTVFFSANPADGKTVMTGVGGSLYINTAENTYGGLYSGPTIFQSLSEPDPSDENAQFGSQSIQSKGYYVSETSTYLYYQSASGSYGAILFPSNDPPSCIMGLTCIAQSHTSATQADGFKVGNSHAKVRTSFAMQIISTNPAPAPCLITISHRFNNELGPMSNGQSLGVLPAARSLALNPYFSPYIFTNVPSGSLVGIPANDAVDFGFSFLAASPTLFQSIILPNCTNSLTVTVSNISVGSFSGGQTVYFTNYPSGGVCQFDVSADGQPLPTNSGLELPVLLAFNSPTGAFTLAPQPIRIIAPVTDQTLRSGQDLIIQPIVSSEQPVQYQWQLQGVDLPEQTNVLLSIAAFTTTNAGHYRLKMQSSLGGTPQSFYSPEASIVAVSAPALSYASIVNGTNGFIHLTANGTPWQPFFVEISTNLIDWQTVSTNTISTNGSAVVQIINNSVTPILFVRTSTPLTFRLEP